MKFSIDEMRNDALKRGKGKELERLNKIKAFGGTNAG